MNAIRTGFEIEIQDAHNRAKLGDLHGMTRKLSAAHALAVWADPTLLERYQELETQCWQEYEAWKTTTR